MKFARVDVFFFIDANMIRVTGMTNISATPKPKSSSITGRKWITFHLQKFAKEFAVRSAQVARLI